MNEERISVGLTKESIHRKTAEQAFQTLKRLIIIENGLYVALDVSAYNDQESIECFFRFLHAQTLASYLVEQIYESLSEEKKRLVRHLLKRSGNLDGLYRCLEASVEMRTMKEEAKYENMDVSFEKNPDIAILRRSWFSVIDGGKK